MGKLVFIFPTVGTLTDHWHCGGGLVVIAHDRAHAEALIRERAPDATLTEAEWAAAVVHPIARPDEDVAGEVWVFPDAGCC
jgi:hypothetical protein